MIRRFSVVIIASLVVVLASACNSSTTAPTGGGGNGPDLPGQNNSVYTPQPPPSTTVDIRNMDGTLSGRKLQVSMVEFRPGKDQPIVVGKDTGFDLEFKTSDGLPCNCTAFAQGLGANSASEAMSGQFFSTSFWGSGASVIAISGASRRVPVGSQATSPATVPFALTRIWAIQAMGTDIRWPSTDPHGSIVSDRLNWGGQ